MPLSEDTDRVWYCLSSNLRKPEADLLCELRDGEYMRVSKRIRGKEQYRQDLRQTIWMQ